MGRKSEHSKVDQMSSQKQSFEAEDDIKGLLVTVQKKIKKLRKEERSATKDTSDGQPALRIGSQSYPVMCRFFLSGSCRNKDCRFSHETSTHPCKFLHISGSCRQMAMCKFSHQRFVSDDHLRSFVLDNTEAFLNHIRNGITTPTSEYALKRGILNRTDCANKEDERVATLLRLAPELTPELGHNRPHAPLAAPSDLSSAAQTKTQKLQINFF